MKIVLSAAMTVLMAKAAMADVPNVVTDIAPVHGLVARVMEGVGTPQLIVPPSASPHDHAMRPSEARALSQADVVVWMGHTLTPWLEGSIDALAAGADQIELQDIAPVSLSFREGVGFEAHEHEGHGHDDHADEGHDDHGDEDHGDEVDPHMWLDPQNAIGWVNVIADRLAAQDPENASVYRANSSAAVAEISMLSDQIAARMEPLQGRSFVVFHDAFHYFEARYGVEAAGAISASDAQAPSPRRLREIEHVIEDAGAKCVFAEPQFNPGIVEAVAGQTNVHMIDPIGFELTLGPQMYLQLLSQIADGFEVCLSH